MQKNKIPVGSCFFALPVYLSIKKSFAGCDNDSLSFFEADNPNIQYAGRIDFSNIKLPRFWSPGVYVNASFEGTSCRIVLNDEVQYGVMHNYIEIVVDGKAKRIRLNEKENTIKAAEALSSGKHRK